MNTRIAAYRSALAAVQTWSTDLVMTTRDDLRRVQLLGGLNATGDAYLAACTTVCDKDRADRWAASRTAE